MKLILVLILYKVRSDVGSGGVMFRSGRPGSTDASQSFDVQQRARKYFIKTTNLVY